jgi:hypothetical protein
MAQADTDLPAALGDGGEENFTAFAEKVKQYADSTGAHAQEEE